MLQELLEASLNEELETYGVDIASGRMSDREYEAAVRELADRQAATAAETSPAVAARVEEMRRVLAWHLHKARNLFPITLNAPFFSTSNLFSLNLALLICLADEPLRHTNLPSSSALMPIATWEPVKREGQRRFSSMCDWDWGKQGAICRNILEPGAQQMRLQTAPSGLPLKKGVHSTSAMNTVQVADGVDAKFHILPNGQVAAQQKLARPPPPPLAPLRRSRSLSPKRAAGGLLGRLCCRFRCIPPSLFLNAHPTLSCPILCPIAFPTRSRCTWSWISGECGLEECSDSKKTSLLFRSPSSKAKRGRRDRSNLDQAAAIAAYRDTYGASSSTLFPVCPYLGLLQGISRNHLVTPAAQKVTGNLDACHSGLRIRDLMLCEQVFLPRSAARSWRR